ncbi:iron-sulfur cluster assembly accessory protein Isa2, putative [Metarhizium acridum CQMa 102]|uniref:Iron-sulfur cluster assembly accessory protein Isa2, putative n=1 Tax=Metarhizium acridum (strain CQMa 102) TaxID=655827 RepID=E9EDQ2_METAQ|nr:iron-sulfur cluster assembly accessory protein Isa2, putative [Metarhizium acridum CQMa 102]EFY85981.1 iron-sulfur cluster assembly accessory protein Isa2, putative [Metarhizium acridum CQMa 102]
MASVGCANGASAARSFIQIAKRGYSTAAARSSAPLEFLLPQTVSTTDCRAAFLLRSTKTTRPSRTGRACLRGTPFSGGLRQSQKRTFTTTASRQATQRFGNWYSILQKALMLMFSAVQRLSQIMKKDDNPNLALRIQVESGGCHGFQYLMSLVTIPPKDTAEWSTVVNEDDTIFQFSDEADTAGSSEHGPRIILDEPSLNLLKGSKVDFTMELIGSQFKIVDNPYATSSCGCGTSFDIKL